MKEMLLAAWKWVVIAAVLGAVGFFILFGLGKKRGTRAYRLRVALWTLALGLMGGGALLTTAACDKGEKEKEEDAQKVPDFQGTCYAAPMDYFAQPDEKDARAVPDSQDEELLIECYAPIMDVRGNDAAETPEITVTCYKPAPDIVTKDGNVQPDQIIMCYEPVLDAKPQPDIMITCYDSIPPDVKPQLVDVQEQPDAADKADMPMPTCYAPPFEPGE
jgi:hypothetical protein